MLEPESSSNDLPQVQDPDGGGQGPPLPQTKKVALPEVRGHPDAEAQEVLKRAKRGGPPVRVGSPAPAPDKLAGSGAANPRYNGSITVAARFREGCYSFLFVL